MIIRMQFFERIIMSKHPNRHSKVKKYFDFVNKPVGRYYYHHCHHHHHHHNHEQQQRQ